MQTQSDDRAQFFITCWHAHAGSYMHLLTDVV